MRRRPRRSLARTQRDREREDTRLNLATVSNNPGMIVGYYIDKHTVSHALRSGRPLGPTHRQLTSQGGPPRRASLWLPQRRLTFRSISPVEPGRVTMSQVRSTVV